MFGTRKDDSLTAKKIACCALTVALLIGGQCALGFVAGIEVVTVILLCFSYCFGAVCGVLTAIAFSILRCFIWGFYPAVILLYLIYYPLFALVFALTGKIKDEFFDGAEAGLAIAVNLILITAVTACICAVVFDLIKISRLYKATITMLLYVIAGLCLCLDIGFNAVFAAIKRKGTDGGKILKLVFLTAIAAVCTICFTLIDDVISPLFVGMSKTGALAYFYASFTAMLPQVVCTVVTVTTLFYPLCAVMNRFSGKKPT